MTDSFRISQRAVAASALALVLGGASFAPAFADGDGKGGKNEGEKGKKSGQSRSQGRSGSGNASNGSSHGSASQGRQNNTPAPARQGGGERPSGDTRGAQQDPAGNNGTFKVDGLAYDDGLGNEPHVTCGFRLKFYGFDEGQTGDITIAGQAPSGSGVVSRKNDVLISDDAAGGGPNDVDEVVEYTMADLDLSGLTAHPKQGYHLKVTLETDTPGGVKHKVFWLEPCVAPTTPPAVGGTGNETGGGGGTGSGNEVGGTGSAVGAVGGETQDRTAVLGTRFTRVERANRGDASVLGAALTRGPALAYTGSFTEWLLALGGGLVAAGAGVLGWGHRARREHA